MGVELASFPLPDVGSADPEGAVAGLGACVGGAFGVAERALSRCHECCSGLGLPDLVAVLEQMLVGHIDGLLVQVLSRPAQLFTL